MVFSCILAETYVFEVVCYVTWYLALLDGCVRMESVIWILLVHVESILK